MAKYKQCLLERKSVLQRVWIPLEFANEGKFLKIRPPAKQRGCLVEGAGEWEDGWKVLEVSHRTISQDELDAQRSAQRELARTLEGH